MSTLHQITNAKDGESFTSVGPVVISRQMAARLSKNEKVYSIASLKSAGNEVSLMLWEQAAKWQLPIGVELTLKGKFTKSLYNGSVTLNSEELVKPEGAVEVKETDIIGKTVKPSMKDCILAGLRAVDYITRMEHPELAEAAFTFAANALIQGVKPE